MGKFSYDKDVLENLRIAEEETHLLDRLLDYESAREAHANKSHAAIDKRLSLKEAIGEYVKDGDILTDTGFAYVRTPIVAYFEIIRQGIKGLQNIGSPATNQSYMIPFGTVTHSHWSYCGAEMRGTDRQMSRCVKAGKTKILSEWSHGSMAQGFKAAQLGVPGMYSKQLLGSDIIKYNPFVRSVDNPVKTEKDPCVFIPALYPDVTVIHVHQADKFGNAKIYGPVINDVAIASAARKVIITAEEIVPPDALRNDNKGVVIPFVYVDAVVELPYGALLGHMPGLYYWPRRMWEKILRHWAYNEDMIDDFYETFILGCKDQYDIIDKLLGGSKWMVNAKRLTRAEEYDNEDEGVDFNYTEWTREDPNPEDVTDQFKPIY
ncbi:CoA transferase subunit A [Desulfoluna sp.]|uniref:CoA transferase subunit A n=1 Tax=Desulfoluna sp. TaxID=2045199 RepID=UPI002604EEFD|nr:CoA-transferase [Desulfoluna sp.]